MPDGSLGDWSSVPDKDLSASPYQYTIYCLSGGHLGVWKTLALSFTVCYLRLITRTS